MFQKFLGLLGTNGTQPQAAKALSPDQTSSWLTRIGNGCALLLVCWLGGQLWYNGARVLETRGSSISLGTFCKVLCCGMAALLVKPDYGPVVEAREEKEEPREQEMNLINMGVAWTSENPDTYKTAGLILVDELAKLADGSMN